MTAAEFGEPQRQFTIAAQPVAEDQHMARAVHRLDREHPLVAAFGDEHVFAEVLPMSGGFPQATVEQQRSLHLLVTGRVEPAAHVILDDAEQLPALGVPEDAADRLFLQMEQVELASEAAMVAALGFLEPEKVLVEVFLARPGGAVDALQLGVVRIAAPIGARDVHQLERLSEPASRGQMRTDAQINKIALAIEADLLLARDLADIFGLVALAEPVEERDGLVAIPNLAGDRLVAAHDVAHTLFDTRQIVGGERRRARKIVVEAGSGRRAEGDLSFGVELLDALGHTWGASVAKKSVAPGHLAGVV